MSLSGLLLLVAVSPVPNKVIACITRTVQVEKVKVVNRERVLIQGMGLNIEVNE